MGIFYRSASMHLALAVALIGAARVAGDQPHAMFAPLAVKSLLLDGWASGDRMIAVGERGHILMSDDGGLTWRQKPVPTRAMLTAVAFSDDRQGCAVGHDETILRTQDGGRTWTLAHSAPEKERPLLSALFLDGKRGFAAGAYGAFLRTHDGGVTWEEAGFDGEDLHLNHLARSASGLLYLAGESGALFRSDDEGENWKALPSPYGGSFFGTLPLEGGTVLAFGLRGNLFRSEDFGETWVKAATGAEALLGHGTVLADGAVVVSGLAGTVLVSRDSGRSFALVQLEDRQGIAAVLEAADGRLVRLGEGGANPLRLPDLTAIATGDRFDKGGRAWRCATR